MMKLSSLNQESELAIMTIWSYDSVEMDFVNLMFHFKWAAILECIK